MPDSYPTEMRLHKGESWPVEGHVTGTPRSCDHNVRRAKLELRRIGWIDQKGNIWLSTNDWAAAGGPNGSITALLIAPGCD